MLELSSEELDRYARQLSLQELGADGQLILKKSRVAIVGLGGLGSPVALYLAAAGVGELVLIDPDCVGVSNLQRQILHTTSRVGQKKSDSAQRMLSDVNPFVKLFPISERVDTENAQRIFHGCHAVVDASDNYATRFLLARITREMKIPMIHGAVMKFAGQVAVFAPHLGTACYECMFPDNSEMQSSDTASAHGILGAHVGLVGSIQAMETIKALVGIKSPLLGAMLSIDSLRLRFSLIPLQSNSNCNCQSSSRK
ncbi:MAG: HesA/MoeB/ThiF family protein [Akkermansia sp.]|nr:HesA/MoeB/ThiF family protein [Akkermansia sp.]